MPQDDIHAVERGAHWVPRVQGKFVPDEEELAPRPKGALQSSKVTLATPGKFLGISGLGFTKCVALPPTHAIPSRACTFLHLAACVDHTDIS